MGTVNDKEILKIKKKVSNMLNDLSAGEPTYIKSRMEEELKPIIKSMQDKELKKDLKELVGSLPEPGEVCIRLYLKQDSIKSNSDLRPLFEEAFTLLYTLAGVEEMN